MNITANMRRAFLASAALLALADPVHGQDAGSEDQAQQQAEETEGGVTLLEQITVAASKFSEDVFESLTATSVVTEERIQQRQPSNIQQILQGVPGVSTAGTQDNTGLGVSINIRGLQDFGRVAMITDGARNNFSRNDHGSASAMWIEPELLKQVTIVRGPVSNIYGSGAIGGVAVFETKSGSDFLKDGEQMAGSLKMGYETNGDGMLGSVTGAIRPIDAIDGIANLTYRQRDDYEGGDGDTVDNTEYEVLGGLAKTVIRPSEFQDLTLGFIGHSDNWREPGSTQQETDLDETVLTAKYRYHGNPNQPLIDYTLSGYVNDTLMDQTSLSDSFRFDQVNGGFILVPAGSTRSFGLATTGFDTNNTSRFDTGAIRHTFTLGGDWFKDEVDVEDPLGGSYVYSPSGERQAWGGFLQDRMEYSDWVELIGGLRYDAYSLESVDGVYDAEDDRISPRVTLGISPLERTSLHGIQVYGTYAEGYRAPSVIETLMTGMHPAGVAFPFLPNPDLTPETAHTFEVGLNIKRDNIFTEGDGFRAKAAYFHNTVDDFIGLNTDISPFPGPNFNPACTFNPGPGVIPICAQFQNFEKVVIEGVEFELLYDRGTFFSGLSGSFLKGEDKETDEPLLSVPQDQLGGFLGFRAFDQRLVFGGEVYHYFEHKLADGSEYTVVNLFAGYEVSQQLRLDARIDNLFDESYANYLNEAVGVGDFLEPGFNAKLAATIRFGT
jgi:hemoglobin/transferrin/lactoferrin receptor protein